MLLPDDPDEGRSVLNTIIEITCECIMTQLSVLSNINKITCECLTTYVDPADTQPADLTPQPRHDS